MGSNTPRKPKSSLLNTLPTPNNPSLAPSDVKCVTQTQETDPFSNTPPDHQQILNLLCAAEHADNTPQWQSPQAQLVITPVIPSPNRAAIQNNVAAELFKVNSRGKRLKEISRNSGALKAQKKAHTQIHLRIFCGSFTRSMSTIMLISYKLKHYPPLKSSSLLTNSGETIQMLKGKGMP